MEWKALFTTAEIEQLTNNYKEQEPLKGTGKERDFQPVVKLFDPFGAATWLLTECDDDGLAFGLCDMGFGTPELGYVSMDEIASIKLAEGVLRIEKDIAFTATQTLSAYASEARKDGCIKA